MIAANEGSRLEREERGAARARGTLFFDSSGNVVSFPWPERTVPYRFDEKVTPEMRLVVREGMNAIERHSCVRFELYDTEAHEGKVFLDVVALETRFCRASLGYRPNQKRILGLHQKCCKRKFIVLHELLHALGMMHTHQRNDRNEYVEIYRDNIIPDYLDQYNTIFSEYYGLPYDFKSVMHYGAQAFVRKDANHTMRPREIKDASGAMAPLLTLARKKKMSRGDIAWLNRVYGCSRLYLGDDLPGAVAYKDWLKSEQAKQNYEMLHYIVPDEVISTSQMSLN
ncbi:low choriolytic enzyme-like [Penaeus chinensis]|uniref:low choriolytic enzyme-like n=1 Tax=Penaeus chinensis TaxID=139456 RepID=UPI001FB797C2|nr:low choriolytic enzyme-like [Penaeus chinensis]